MDLILSNLTYYDVYQILLMLVILIIGLAVCLLFTKNHKDLKIIISLYVWHTFFSFLYFFIFLNTSADAKSYYIWSLTRESFSLYPGTRFITYFTVFFSKIIGANYLNTTLCYGLFGTLGLIFLYLSIKSILSNLNKLWILVLFMPSMSFWSAGLGKDAIAFMAACLFLFGITESKKHRLALIFAFLAMFMVRPHIAATMLVSFAIYFIIKSKAHIVLKLLSLPIIMISAALMLQFVQQYVGLDDASLDSFDQYVDKRQGYNQGGGSSLDISSMNYPMQMFTYIFRPLPFEAQSLLALITSLENTILLLLFLYIILKSKFNFSSFIEYKNLWLLTYIFVTCTILAITTANLGIATRQKWMFMPVLIYLLIYAFHDYKIKSNKAY